MTQAWEFWGLFFGPFKPFRCPDIWKKKKKFCYFWNGADIWRFTSLHVDSVYAESFFDCVLGKKFNLVFIPFRPLIMIPSFFILFCPSKRLKEIFWSYLEFKVKISVHFMLSIRWVRLGVCWAYVEWDLVYTEHKQSETEYAKTAIQYLGHFRSKIKFFLNPVSSCYWVHNSLNDPKKWTLTFCAFVALTALKKNIIFHFDTD